MRVAIMGCGSMGTILGAFLNKGGCSADMIDNYQAHVEVMNKKGARVIGFADECIPVHAITPDQMQGEYDLIFLFTKQTTNDEVLPNVAAHLKADGTVCTLQNGVPEPYVAKYIGNERTVGGTVMWSATFNHPGVSELTQDLRTLDHYFAIGEIDGRVTERIKKVADVLNLMGKTEITTQLMASRWQKLIYNACVSGMSAALSATFGYVVTHSKANACAVQIAGEVKLCCEAEGYKLGPLLNGYSPDFFAIEDEDQYRKAQMIFYNMYQVALNAKASMLQDLEKGRKSEVSMINGYVCGVGRRHGIPTPFCDCVVDIVSKIEKKELPLSIDNIRFFQDNWFKYNPADPHNISQE